MLIYINAGTSWWTFAQILFFLSPVLHHLLWNKLLPRWYNLTQKRFLFYILVISSCGIDNVCILVFAISDKVWCLTQKRDFCTYIVQQSAVYVLLYYHIIRSCTFIIWQHLSHVHIGMYIFKLITQHEAVLKGETNQGIGGRQTQEVKHYTWEKLTFKVRSVENKSWKSRRTTRVKSILWINMWNLYKRPVTKAANIDLMVALMWKSKLYVSLQAITSQLM